jgi:hypothetical protein
VTCSAANRLLVCTSIGCAALDDRELAQLNKLLRKALAGLEES